MTVQDMEREVRLKEGAFMDQNWRNNKSTASTIPTNERTRIKEAKLRMTDVLPKQEQTE